MQKRDGKQALQVAWKVLTRDPWPFVPEFVFAKPRRWRFDWADETTKVAIEVEGVTFFGPAIGRHQSAKGIEGDMQKYNRAIELGWVVMRYSQRMIQNEPFGIVEQIQAVLKQRAEQ